MNLIKTILVIVFSWSSLAMAKSTYKGTTDEGRHLYELKVTNKSYAGGFSKIKRMCNGLSQQPDLSNKEGGYDLYIADHDTLPGDAPDYNDDNPEHVFTAICEI
jgi:hypothetical protein